MSNRERACRIPLFGGKRGYSCQLCAAQVVHYKVAESTPISLLGGAMSIDESVRSYMTPHPITFDLGLSLDDVQKTFVEERFTLAPITDQTGALVGVVTATDLVHEHDADAKLEDVMTSGVVTVHSGDSIGHAARVLSDSNVHHVVVIKDAKPVGVLSVTDIASAVADDPDFTQSAADLASEELVRISVDQMLTEVQTLIDEAGVSAAAVLVNSDIVGTVSQLSILKVPEDERYETRVDEVLDRRVHTLSSDSTIGDLARNLSEEHTRRVFLADSSGEVLGIVTATDLVRYVAGISEIVGPG